MKPPKFFFGPCFHSYNGVKNPEIFLGDLYLAETAKTDQATEVAEKRQLLALDKVGRVWVCVKFDVGIFARLPILQHQGV